MFGAHRFVDLVRSDDYRVFHAVRLDGPPRVRQGQRAHTSRVWCGTRSVWSTGRNR